MEAQTTDLQQRRIKILETNGMERFLYVWEIVFIEGDDNYCKIHLKDGSEPLVRKTLLIYEIELGSLFIRCHKSYLVNRMYVRWLDKKNYKLILETGEKIPFPKNKAKMLRYIIQNNKTTGPKSNTDTSEETLFNLRIIK